MNVTDQSSPSRQSSRDRENRKGSGTQGKARSWMANSPVPVLAGTLVLLLGLYAGALTSLRPPSPGSALSLDAVNRAAVCARAPDPARGAELPSYCKGAETRIVTAKFLDADSRITGTFVRSNNSPEEFWASYPSSDAATNNLLQSLFASEAEVTVDPQTTKRVVRFVAQFLLPLVLLANLFALLFRFIQVGGASGISDFLSFGRAGDKRKRAEEKSGTTFANVAAVGEAIEELAEVRDYLANPSGFSAMGALPPKGVLLVGPPGCGKTLLGRAVAGEARASFYSISGSEFVESLVGVGAARVRDLFAQARAGAPAIIFIDELDAVGRQRGAGMGQGHDEREQTLNELLVQMDGFSPREGIVVIAASNRPDILDPALLRAGRFDRHVTVERPDREGRLEILRLHARARPLEDPERDLPHIATHSSGFTGADLANLLNEGALLAVREGAGAIRRDHLEEAMDRVLSGPKRKGQIISGEEKQRIACHEAGHAVVAASLGKTDSLQKLSIVARGRGIGHLAMLTDDKTILTRQDMQATVAIAMAGFVAEEIFFGQPSTGAEQDLQRATHTARDMAGRYGMSVGLGPVRVLREEQEVFLGRDYLQVRDVAHSTLELLDAEVRRIVDEEKEAARAILTAHRQVVDALAVALVSRETLQTSDLQPILANVRPHLRATGSSHEPARGSSA